MFVRRVEEKNNLKALMVAINIFYSSLMTQPNRLECLSEGLRKKKKNFQLWTLDMKCLLFVTDDTGKLDSVFVRRVKEEEK